MEDVGGGHTLQPHSLGTGGKYPQTHPKFPSFLFGTGRGHKSVDQTTGDLKSHHLQARVTLGVALTAVSVPPRPHFLLAELLCHISNLSQ